LEESIFKQASTTYYWSSKFFPANVRSDVYKLYSFVRVADDFVDIVPQDAKSFYELKSAWQKKLEPTNTLIIQVINNINYLVQKYNFERAWVDAFLQSMEDDLKPPIYKKLDDSLKYVYGSADVIGYMMARILGLDDRAMKAAGLQGRAMQWINFIRDIDEDIVLGRSYFPLEDLKKFNLKDLSKAIAENDQDNFKKFVQLQIDRYKQWQAEAEAGYKYIPKRLLIPVKTASDMYNWTAEQIENDPFIVYQKKVKPKKERIIYKTLTNMV